MTELNARVALENKVLALLTFFEPFNEFDQEEKCRILFGLTDPNDRKTFSELMVKEFFIVCIG
ncbi:hypothetical protein H8L32_07470 [Undibacterium sp. CY18W]|uniref:Uncharacterized protein n=1 Tax=Undibacterium hunanense TaxID=2762292 RepID=A0ABR6ZNY9_9BURK|nr:hypothetical protein [Undibacterium hunanense]MBC3917309.1 hypothetical protein [Undibacterium hunanense]